MMPALKTNHIEQHPQRGLRMGRPDALNILSFRRNQPAPVPTDHNDVRPAIRRVLDWSAGPGPFAGLVQADVVTLFHQQAPLEPRSLWRSLQRLCAGALADLSMKAAPLEDTLELIIWSDDDDFYRIVLRPDEALTDALGLINEVLESLDAFGRLHALPQDAAAGCLLVGYFTDAEAQLLEDNSIELAVI